MKAIKILITVVCTAFFATTNLFSQTEYNKQNQISKWNVSFSHAYYMHQGEGESFQLEVERKVMPKLSLGLYAQGFGCLAPGWNIDYDLDYLPVGGFTAENMRGWQFGTQLSRHIVFRKGSKWAFYLKGRAGVNLSCLHNFAGRYWHWNENWTQKIYYDITEDQSKTFANFEATVGFGLSRHIFKRFSFFAEPALNAQLFNRDYHLNTTQGSVVLSLVGRYGISYSF